MNNFKYSIYCIILFLLLGCDLSSTDLSSKNGDGSQIQETLNENQEQISAVKSVPQDSVIARLGGQAVSMAEIDTTIELRLFDLEWRKYELRRAALKAKIDEYIKKNDHLENFSPESIDVYLTPPPPPRIEFPEDQRPLKGSAYAKVRLALFCSYQSSHCARLQPVIQELEARYKNSINFGFYDFPQSFHRYAKSAANAVHCAADLATPWKFQSAIYADVSQLNTERYLAIAGQLGFDKTIFSACINEFRYKDKIESDMSLGQSFGLGNVPVLFINGLYVKGPHTADGFGYYIDEELSRLGAIKPVLSTLPIQLLATSLSNKTEESTAIIQYLETGEIRTYKTGEPLNDKIKLVTIEEARILIDHRGQLEFILLKNNLDAQSFSNSDHSDTESVEQETTDIRSPDEQESPKKYRELQQTGELRLSRIWVEEQLNNQHELEEHFYAAEHEVEGVHLLKLKDVAKQEFYKMLGLQSGDVVLRVNEEFVHDAHNPLWETLQNEEKVTLLVMRKGFPVRYDYKIK